MSPANHRQRTPAEQAIRDEQHENARAEMKSLEEGDSVPSDPHDWPTGKAKFLTFGSEADDAYGDGATAMIGPAGLELNAGGSKSIRGATADGRSPSTDSPAPRVRGWFRFGRRSKPAG